MNLALITQDFPPETGGIQTYSAELAKRFAQKCGVFLVIAPDKPEARRVDREMPFPVRRIKAKNSLLGLKSIVKAPAILAENDIRSVFHAQWQTLPASIVARKRGVIDRIFCAVHARELLFNPFQQYPIAGRGYEKYKRRLLAKVDHFFPVSEYTARELRRHGVKDDCITVVINGANPDEFYPIDASAARRSTGVQAEQVLLSVARLVSRKGVDTALRAFKTVLQNNPQSRYVIVGEGPQEPQLKKLAMDLNINDAVDFAGKAPHKTLINYYNTCDVFVMPAKTENPDIEGFGIVFLEANACGKPVIGTYSGGIPSAIINRETGLLVKEDDPKALAEAINELFDNPSLAAKLGKNGRLRVENEANWDILAQKLFDSMKSTI